MTEVLIRPGPEPRSARPVLSRRAAAEVGVYAGAALVLLALGMVATRGWASWGEPMRWASAGLTAVALITAGLYVRLPWSRQPGDARRRAVSAMLTAGAGIALVGSSLSLGVRQGQSTTTAIAASLLGAAGMALVVAAARSPLSETALLASLAWAVWVLVPPGPGTWAGLVGLGVAWVALGARVARGSRTAAVAGALVALTAAVGLADGPWTWWVRAALAGVAAFGLGAFLRGWANPWLALGAGAATALAASVAGAVIGPALALVVGGLATMIVSAIALRGTRRE